MSVLHSLVALVSPVATSSANTSSQQLSKLPTFTVQTMDITVILNELVAYAIILAGFLSIVFLLWGGIQFIISGGKDDKVKAATGTIRNAIIGLLVTILSVSIINFISQLFRLSIINYISWAHILEIINNLLSFKLT